MDVVNEVKKKAEQGGGKESKARKILVPLAASAVSGATAYLARKAPGLIREKVLPKLKESGAATEAIAKAKDAVTEWIGSVAGETSRPSGATRTAAQKLSTKERERERQERAKRRRERKQAISS